MNKENENGKTFFCKACEQEARYGLPKNHIQTHTCGLNPKSEQECTYDKRNREAEESSKECHRIEDDKRFESFSVEQEVSEIIKEEVKIREILQKYIVAFSLNVGGIDYSENLVLLTKELVSLFSQSYQAGKKEGNREVRENLPKVGIYWL